MRFPIFHILASLTALALLPSILARKPRFQPRATPIAGTSAALQPAPGPVTLRQHHVTRADTDTCVYLDAGLDGLLGLLHLPLDLGSLLDLCLCLSGIPDLISADVTLQALVNTLGLAAVEADLTLLITDSPASEQCTYPANSQAACVEGNPCGFTCNAPYIQDGGSCVCPAPYCECDGQCSTQACGSAVPRSLYARNGNRIEKRVKTSEGITSFARAQATCAENETVCGVPGGSKKGFECLDVNTELESCGGCTIPNPFLVQSNFTVNAPGKDCTGIAGVQDVACVLGRCSVKTCAQGWEVAPGAEACTKTQGSVATSGFGTIETSQALRMQG